jgi:hypothetical protein
MHLDTEPLRGLRGELAEGQPGILLEQGLQVVQHRPGELVAPFGARLARDQRGQPAGGQRRPGVVGALAREPERPGGRGHRHAFHLDLPHHLVLHLQQIGGIEETARGERRVGHLLRIAVQRP